MSTSNLERAALAEKAALKRKAREEKLTRALVLHAEGFSADAIARRLGIDYRAVKDAVQGAGVVG